MSESLAERTDRFMTRFNLADLDGIVASFAAGGVYHDPVGHAHSGQDAIRAALAPLFDGSMGKLHYAIQETLLDESDERALVTWTLSMTAQDGVISRLRGLDILRFSGQELREKNCYCKADALHFE